MRSILIGIALLIAIAKSTAQSSGFGLGIIVGDPTGLSAKAWTGGDRAFAFALAWGGLGHDGGYFQAHGDYLFHNFSLINVSKGQLALHYGPGVRLRIWGGDRYYDNGSYHDSNGGHTRLGIRFPVGLTYLFDGAPVDVFFELAPTLDLIPGTSFDMDGGLGFRYWFGK